jgi:hypothetical protein
VYTSGGAHQYPRQMLRLRIASGGLINKIADATARGIRKMEVSWNVKEGLGLVFMGGG